MVETSAQWLATAFVMSPLPLRPGSLWLRSTVAPPLLALAHLACGGPASDTPGGVVAPPGAGGTLAPAGDGVPEAVADDGASDTAGDTSGGDGARGDDGAGRPSSEVTPLPSQQPPEPGPTSGTDSPEGSGSEPVAGEGTAVPEPCAEPGVLAPGNQELSLAHDGVERRFLVHVPADLDPVLRVPLVVDLHGLTSSAGAQAAISGWRRKADAEGFIVAHPQGLNASWNGGDLCCGDSQRTGVDDEGFVRALVARLRADACIDPARVYATGLSNGGAMSHLLACNAADLFAATAPVSMGNGTRPCEPSRPVSVVMTRGTRDTLVAFEGGLFPGAREDFEAWAERNGCQGEPEPHGALCEAYTRCEAGVEVVACAIDAGHVLYDNDQGFSVPDTVWQTFERQRLP